MAPLHKIPLLENKKLKGLVYEVLILKCFVFEFQCPIGLFSERRKYVLLRETGWSFETHVIGGLEKA